MSKLKELLAELCPNGVEYKELNEIAQYAKNRIDAKDVNKSTYVSVENLLQNKKGKTASNNIPTDGKVIRFEMGDILIGNIRPYLRKIWLSDCTGGTNGDVLAVQIYDKTKVVPKFLYYVLSSENFFLYDIQNSKGAKMPRGSKDAVMKYKLPVPPLPVQEEIVRILDSFTSLTAELQARQKQYEYYRDRLLTFDVHGGGQVKFNGKHLKKLLRLELVAAIRTRDWKQVCILFLFVLKNRFGKTNMNMMKQQS